MSNFQNVINCVQPEYAVQPKINFALKANLEDVDMSVLIAFEAAQCEGEPDLIVELIDLYLADFPQQLSVMKDCVLKADEVSLKRAAHTLRGSSANLGVNGVAVLCEELEKTDSSESFQQSSILINRLDQTFARVKTVFLVERQSRI